MKPMFPPLFALAATLFTAVTGTASEATFEAIKIEAGADLYASECRRCHATDTDHESYGPPLETVLGRVAGSYPDYDYSDALATSGIVWTEAALRAWIEDNTGFMPGTMDAVARMKEALNTPMPCASLRMKLIPAK